MFIVSNDFLVVYREERSSNTLYQELSFQESSILEDSSEITGIIISKKCSSLHNFIIVDDVFPFPFRQVTGSIRASLLRQVLFIFSFYIVPFLRSLVYSFLTVILDGKKKQKMNFFSFCFWVFSNY